MANDSIYVKQSDKKRLAEMARQANRKLVDMLRYLMDLHDGMTPGQRTYVISGKGRRPDTQEAR